MNLDMSVHRLKIVLLITVGAQDIKLWTHSHNSKKPKLGRIEKPNVRAKHLALREQPDSWTVLTESEAGALTNTGGEKSEGARRLAAQLDLDLPIVSADGRLCLNAPKIEPVVEGILTHSDKMEVVGALVFYTERPEELGEKKTPSWEYENEPVASGHVAALYLQERLGLQSHRVAIVNCMEDCVGRYEGSVNEHNDFPLRRQIVHRMDCAVADFLSLQSGEFARDVVPAVMTTGGIDPFKHVLQAIAELRFVSSVRDLSMPKTDSDNAPQWCKLIEERLCAEAPRITRHEAISARARALDLLRRGDPVSAWAAVNRLAGSQLDMWWLVPLEQTASYFGGAGAVPSMDDQNRLFPAPSNETATEIWHQAFSEINLSINDHLEQHKRYALNSAMRVELALHGNDRQSRRYVDALVAVCSLIDAAVIARAILFLHGKGNQEGIEGLIEKYPFDRDWFFAHKNAGHSDGKMPNNSRNAWFGRWHKQIRRENSELQANLMKYFADLIELERILGMQNSEGKSLRALRNSASHRALSAVNISQIAELAEHKSRPLWSPPGPQRIGEHALGFTSTNGDPGPIPAVLKSIGFDKPADIHQRLIGSLESILLTCEPEMGP